MIATLQAEYRKMMATKVWWLLLIAMTATTVVMAALTTWAFLDQSLAPARLLRVAVGSAASLCYVFPLALGVIMVASEYRYHTIATAMLGEPCRMRFVLGKLIIAMPFGLIFGILGTAAGAITGIVMLHWKRLAVPIGATAVIHTVILSVLLLAIWTILGICLGMLITSQSVAIIGIVVFTQLAEPIIRLAFQQWETGKTIIKFLPGAAGEAILGTSFLTASNLNQLLEPWQGLAVLAGYGLTMLIAGTIRITKSDIN